MDILFLQSALMQILVFAILSLPIPMILGMMWYGPLFGKPWMKAVGKTQDDLTMGPGLIIATAAAWLLTSVTVATGVAFLFYAPLVQGMVGAGIYSLPFLLTLILTSLAYFGLGLNHIIMAKNYQGQPMSLALIDFGYQYLGIITLATLHFFLFASGWLSA